MTHLINKEGESRLQKIGETYFIIDPQGNKVECADNLIRNWVFTKQYTGHEEKAFFQLLEAGIEIPLCYEVREICCLMLTELGECDCVINRLSHWGCKNRQKFAYFKEPKPEKNYLLKFAQEVAKKEMLPYTARLEKLREPERKQEKTFMQILNQLAHDAGKRFHLPSYGPEMLERAAKEYASVSNIHAKGFATVINKLNECYLPENVECDGGFCPGCWKDVVREAIKMLKLMQKA